MKKIALFIAVWGALTALPSLSHAAVNIFACSPEWAALAEEIGGDKVEVKSATNANQDVHHIRAKPSLLAAMRKADMVFCTGASLESGWLPILIKKAGGPDVQPETIGWIMASDYVDKLQVMHKADRSMGHIHPEGNPHVHLDPNNIVTVANVLAERLIMLDPDNRQYYEQSVSSFENDWKSYIAQWESTAADLKGKKVVVYHNAWACLLKWLDMDIVATLEPKPGIPPSASHLEKVVQNVNGQDVTAILVAPFENEDAAEWLSGKTGIPISKQPFIVGGNNQAKDLKSLFDETLRLLKEAE